MSQYLPVLVYVLAATAVLFIAGLGAAGTRRGAVRYMKVWAQVVLTLVGAAAVIALAVGGIRAFL
jgi:hypothetical protein